MPDVIHWDEALDLIRILRDDPSSQFATAVEGFKHPLSREGWMLADLIDVQGSSKVGKKWKTYPRPSPSKTADKQRLGNADGLSPDDVKARLRLAALGQTAVG